MMDFHYSHSFSSSPTINTLLTCQLLRIILPGAARFKQQLQQQKNNNNNNTTDLDNLLAGLRTLGALYLATTTTTAAAGEARKEGGGRRRQQEHGDWLCLQTIQEQQYWYSRKHSYAVEEQERASMRPHERLHPDHNDNNNNKKNNDHLQQQPAQQGQQQQAVGPPNSIAYEWIGRDCFCREEDKNNNSHESTTTFTGKDPTDPLTATTTATKKNTKQQQQQRVALRTTVDSHPLLDADTVALLRRTAAKYRERHCCGTGDAFTMQYAGNTDVHLSNLFLLDNNDDDKNNMDKIYLQNKIDQALQERVYPLVRHAFGHDRHFFPNPTHPLCLYSALIVQYNGDDHHATRIMSSSSSSKNSRILAASLPRHVDSGLVSVNIALSPVDEFKGGGTFFENLLCFDDKDDMSAAAASTLNAIHLPVGPGHAVAHFSTEPHSGARTTAGIREILVFFVMTRQPNVVVSDDHPNAADQGLVISPVEQSFYLKTTLVDQQVLLEDKIKCLELAVRQNPLDGEAFYQLGFRWIQKMQYDNDDKEARTAEDRDASAVDCTDKAIECLERAAQLCPYDARTLGLLGTAYLQRIQNHDRTRRNTADLAIPAAAQSREQSLTEKSEVEEVVRALKKSVQIGRALVEIGCGNGMDLAASLLMLAEVLVTEQQQPDYHQALGCLQGIAELLPEGPYRTEHQASMMERTDLLISKCQTHPLDARVL